jgi:hypothetical protein
MKSRPVGWVGVALVAVGMMSCGGGGGPTLYPVSGAVFFEGKPAEGATVVFHPADGDAGKPKPSGTVAADGKFTLDTYPRGPGAPAGDYLVLVTWYPPDARSMDNPKNKLPARYADAAAADVLKATVQAGPTDLAPFQLKK